MPNSILNQPQFHDEAAAFAKLESIVWPNGPVCPHCGGVGRVYPLNGVKDKKGRVRAGLWKCYAKECRKQFRVTVGTVFESMLIPLHKALQAVHLLCSSKKGISAHQLSRTLEIDYKSAWFLAHRIREAMRTGGLAPMGGSGKTVEIDETFVGRLEGQPKRPVGWGHKNVVLTLVERGGSARSFHVAGVTMANLLPVIRENVGRESAVMTDELNTYSKLGDEFAKHGTVVHSKKEYVRGDISTNTVEGYFSIFKRGMRGVYQHCSEKHLHRYLAEFDFRYSNRVRLGIDDQDRTSRALKGIAGKRLTYRRTDETASV